MKFKKIKNHDVYELIPNIIRDNRGYFLETIRNNLLKKKIGNFEFKQENESYSKYNTFRGLHLQTNKLQGKLVRVIEGEIYDICLDCRYNSKSYGKSITMILNDKKNNALWIPPGYAHGFLVLSKFAKVIYKCTEYYSKNSQISININDKFLDIKIAQKNKNKFILSKKDSNGLSFAEFSSKFKILKK